MVFSDKQLQGKVQIRFHKYSDTEKGYGDAGTLMYKTMDISDFTEKVEKTFDKKKTYYTYTIKDEVALKLLGNYWWIEIGYDLAKKGQRAKEIKDLQKMLNVLNSSK